MIGIRETFRTFPPEHSFKGRGIQIFWAKPYFTKHKIEIAIELPINFRISLTDREIGFSILGFGIGIRY